MSRDTIPSAVGTTEYSIADEHVAVRFVLQFLSLPLLVG